MVKRKRGEPKTTTDSQHQEDSKTSAMATTSAVTASTLPPPLSSIDLDATRSQTDPKHYRLITLPNGLQALLISDPRAPAGSDTALTRARTASEMTMWSIGGPGNGEEEGENDEGEDDEEDGSDGGDGDDDEEGEEEEGSGSDDDSQSQEASVEEEGGHHHHHDGGHHHGTGMRLAAASMAVGVGSFSDPSTVQGLAHALEHMCFMGSSKYKSENEYDEFISSHGGGSNAMTECEVTVYHFEIPPSHFVQALDIFAQFFISPLMRQDAWDRELQSIESEFNLSRNNDTCRLQQLFCHTSRQGHPYAKFPWGNLQSLRDEPAAKAVDVAAEMRKFHDMYYVASNMRLVVLGMESLDALQDMVMRSFADVKAGVSPSTDLSVFGLPFDESNGLGWLFKVVPVKDIHQLHLTWQVPEQLTKYRSKPWDYLGHLVGHEGEGSILAELKELGWATGICAGVSEGGYDSSTCCAFFTATVTLTLEGVDRWSDIVSLVFQYVHLLRVSGHQKWIFDELKAISEMQYRFQEEIEEGDLVEQLAMQMLPLYHFDNQHVLSGPYLLWDWRPDLLDEIMANITPRQTRIDLLSSTFGRAGSIDHEAAGGGGAGEEKGGVVAPKDVTIDGVGPATNGEDGLSMSSSSLSAAPGAPSRPYDKEPRFGTHYWKELLPRDLLDQWSSPTLHPHLSLPQPNPFVASDFTVKDIVPTTTTTTAAATTTDGIGAEVAARLDEVGGLFPDLQPVAEIIRRTPPTVLPELIVEEPGLKLWHLQDRTFRMPRTAVFLKLATHVAYATARNEVMTELFNRLVKDSLNRTTYMASVAELYYSCKSSELGLELHFHGLSHRLLTLVTLVLDRLFHFLPHLQEKRFETQKEALLRHYSNENLKPGRHARNVRLVMLKERYWFADELAREGATVTIDDLKAFIPQLLSTLHVDCLMHGNCDRDDANQLTTLLRSILTTKAGVSPLSSDGYPTNRVVRLPVGKTLTMALTSMDAGERNSAVEAYWQVGVDTIQDRVVVQMLEQIMEEPLYDTLRTKWQLGYSVNVGIRITNGVLGLCIRVHSERYEPSWLHSRIDEFLVRFRDRVLAMEDKHFYKQLLALVQLKLQRDASYNDEGERYWGEILERRYHFDVNRLEANSLLLTVTKERVLDLLDKYVSPLSPSAAHLCVQVVGQASRQARASAASATTSPDRGGKARGHHHNHHEASPNRHVSSSPARSPVKPVRTVVSVGSQVEDICGDQVGGMPKEYFPNLV